MTLKLSVNNTVAGVSKVNSSRFFYFLSFVEYFQNLRNFSEKFLHSIDKEENQIKKISKLIKCILMTQCPLKLTCRK